MSALSLFRWLYTIAVFIILSFGVIGETFGETLGKHCAEKTENNRIIPDGGIFVELPKSFGFIGTAVVLAVPFRDSVGT